MGPAPALASLPVDQALRALAAVGGCVLATALEPAEVIDCLSHWEAPVPDAFAKPRAAPRPLQSRAWRPSRPPPPPDA